MITDNDEPVQDWLQPLSAKYTPRRCLYTIGSNEMKLHAIDNGKAGHLSARFGAKIKKMLTANRKGG